MAKGAQLELVLNAIKQKRKIVVMLAPSFVAAFNYPDILVYLREAGFDKIVELTFGAKLVNKKYHELLECNDSCFWISSVCPGIAITVKQKFPKLVKSLMPFVSPMVATGRICRKLYPKHKVLFISPCNMKKIEAKENPKDVDYVLDCLELKQLFKVLKLDISKKLKLKNKRIHFDKFYNDYTKIYPLAGGLSKTAHIKGVLMPNQKKIIDGILEVEKFLKKPNKDIKFLDCNFCIGGCIGGPCLAPELSLEKKKQRVLDYVKLAMHEKIPKADLGILEKAKNIDLRQKY